MYKIVGLWRRMKIKMENVATRSEVDFPCKSSTKGTKWAVEREMERKGWLFVDGRTLSRPYSNRLIVLFAWRRSRFADRDSGNNNERVSCGTSLGLNERWWWKKKEKESRADGVKLSATKPIPQRFFSAVGMHYLCGELRVRKFIINLEWEFLLMPNCD